MSKRRRRRSSGHPSAGRADGDSRKAIDSDPQSGAPAERSIEKPVEERSEAPVETREAVERVPEIDESLAAGLDDTDAEQDFGGWLRRQREIRGIDLRAIAEASKISVRYLEAMEENRFDILPASVFTKGFLRQYALFVGLDPEEVVNFYIDARRRDDEQIAEQVEPPVRRRSRSRADNLRWVVAALVLAVLLAVTLWLMSIFSDDEPADDAPPVAAATPAVTTPVERRPAVVDEPVAGTASMSLATSSPTAAAPAPSDPPAPAMAPVDVTLDFSAECWVEASIDGRRDTAEMFIQGSSLRLEGEQYVDIKVGDIRSVRIEVNGIPYEPPPRVAETSVRRIHIDLETVASLRGSVDAAAADVRAGEE